MATTTTNFGWDIPQSTDLVKDGATAIAALGQDIDTAFVDFKGGTTGQVLKKTSATDLDVEWGTASSGLTLINTTSFSAVASQSINSVFSATYEFYMIQMKVVCSLNTQNFNWRWRASGSDITASNYYFARSNTTTGGVVSGNGTGATTTATLNQIATGHGFYSIFAGHTQTEPRLNGNSYNSELSGLTTFASGYRATQAVDGFTVYPASGTITGTISVYGLAN
jgi:hypothetical protein